MAPPPENEETERLLAPNNNGSDEPQQLAIDVNPNSSSSSSIAVAQGPNATSDEKLSTGKAAPPSTTVTSAAAEKPGSLASVSSVGSISSAKEKDLALCRICLEEDTISNLEQPCACSGTQKYAHHECIQRWVNEKGHLRCEICEQQYRGNYTVPPQPIPVDNIPLFAPMFVRVDGDQDTARYDYLDETDHYYQRNPGMSWCFSFIIFVMFLIVLHHTMIAADGMDSDGSGSPGSGGQQQADEYATSLTLFLFWVGTKAFLIGIPLYTVMKIAARQARREQYEALVRSGMFEAPSNRRLLVRIRPVADSRRSGDGAPQPTGANAV